MKINNKGFIGSILLIIIIGFVFLIILILAIDFQKTMNHSVGWVWQDRNGTAVKEFIKEEDGCIYFIDVYDHESKACGDYVIKKY